MEEQDKLQQTQEVVQEAVVEQVLLVLIHLRLKLVVMVEQEFQQVFQDHPLQEVVEVEVEQTDKIQVHQQVHHLQHQEMEEQVVEEKLEDHLQVLFHKQVFQVQQTQEVVEVEMAHLDILLANLQEQVVQE
jgi:hypothetical protein